MVVSQKWVASNLIAACVGHRTREKEFSMSSQTERNSRKTADNQERSTTVRSVIRALSLLEALADAGAPVSLKELSRTLELHPSTTHRLLSSLKTCGFAIQDPQTSSYALGPKCLSLNRRDSHHAMLQILARPELIQLAEKTRETTNLVVMNQFAGTYIDQVPSPYRCFSPSQ